MRAVVWRPESNEPGVLGRVSDETLGLTACARLSGALSDGSATISVDMEGMQDKRTDWLSHYVFVRLIEFGAFVEKRLKDAWHGVPVDRVHAVELRLPEQHRAQAYIAGTSARVLTPATEPLGGVLAAGLTFLLTEYLRRSRA